MQLLLPRVAALAFLWSWSVADTTLDVPSRFLRWRVQCNRGFTLFAIASRALEMEEDDRSSSDRSPRSRAPRKASHHVQNAPERTNVACSGAAAWALVCNRRLNQNRRGKATVAALSARLWPRDVAGRGARAVTHTAKGSEQRAHSSSQRDCKP